MAEEAKQKAVEQVIEKAEVDNEVGKIKVKKKPSMKKI